MFPYLEKRWGKDWRRKLGTVLFIVYALVFLLTSLFTDLKGQDQATMTNTFATISGVLLALWFAIPRTQEGMKLQPVTISGLLSALFFSLTSSISSLAAPTIISPNKPLFLLSAIAFVMSTWFFASSANVFSTKRTT